MARKKKTSPAEDFVQLFALLPWWLCIALAMASYMVCHSVAGRPPAAVVPGVAPMQQIGPVLTSSVVQHLCLIGQYVLPLLFTVAAALSAWRRRVRQGLLQQASDVRGASVTDGMSWQQFELLIGEGFRRKGYLVMETGGSGPDGGVDLVLRRPAANGSEVFLVQCKHWRASKVGVDVVRAHYGVMAARGAAGGFVVTSGQFTQEARKFAEGRNIELIDGHRLPQWLVPPQPRAAASADADAVAALRTARASRAVKPAAPAPAAVPQGGEPSPGRTSQASPAEAAHQARTDSGGTGVHVRAADPSCPVCSQAMVKRVAKRGANTGQVFWGCTQYPACRGTRPA